MVWLGQPVIDHICLANYVKSHLPRICCVSLARLLGEMDAVISQDRVDAIEDGLAIPMVHASRDCKLAGLVVANKEIELALRSLNLGDVDMNSRWGND